MINSGLSGDFGRQRSVLPMSASELLPPEPGQIVVVRGRPAVVIDVKPSGHRQDELLHCVDIDYVDEYIPQEETVLWERERRAELLGSLEFPDVGRLSTKCGQNTGHRSKRCWTHTKERTCFRSITPHCPTGSSRSWLPVASNIIGSTFIAYVPSVETHSQWQVQTSWR